MLPEWETRKEHGTTNTLETRTCAYAYACSYHNVRTSPPGVLSVCSDGGEVYTMRAQGPQELGDTTNKSHGGYDQQITHMRDKTNIRIWVQVFPPLAPLKIPAKEFSCADGAEWLLWSLIII
jgi:hypothetical protein